MPERFGKKKVLGVAGNVARGGVEGYMTGKMIGKPKRFRRKMIHHSRKMIGQMKRFLRKMIHFTVEYELFISGKMNRPFRKNESFYSGEMDHLIPEKSIVHSGKINHFTMENESFNYGNESFNSGK